MINKSKIRFLEDKPPIGAEDERRNAGNTR